MNRKVPKTRRGKNWDKDDAGNAMHRSKSWGGRKDRDPKLDRREWRKGVTYGTN